MKIIKKIQHLFLMAGLLSQSFSCTSGFEEINTDHNKMPVVPALSLLTPTIYYGHWAILNANRTLFGQLMQYSVQTNGFEAISQYTIKDSSPTSLWTNLYRRLNDANEICLIAEQFDNENDLAIGLTIKSWLMANITDIWGDVPCSEALQAANGNFQPKFDAQEDIYKQIFADLDRANELFAQSTSSIDEKYDILYAGNKTRWRKFCNSLKIRLLLRVSNQASMNVPATIKEMLENPAKYPIFTRVDDGATIAYTGALPFINPFYDYKPNEFSGNYRMCSRLVNSMNITTDLRRSLYMTSIVGEYYGIDSGNNQEYILSAMDNGGRGVSRFHDNLQKATFKYGLLNYSELLFCLAEAAHKGWITDNPAGYHAEAVKASLVEWGSTASATAQNAFVTRESVAYNGTLERIIEQKWISLYFVGMESWNDYRRTSLPVMPQGNALDNNEILPTRLRYPAILQSINAKNWKESADKLGGDNMTSKVWWAKSN